MCIKPKQIQWNGWTKQRYRFDESLLRHVLLPCNRPLVGLIARSRQKYPAWCPRFRWTHFLPLQHKAPMCDSISAEVMYENTPEPLKLMFHQSQYYVYTVQQWLAFRYKNLSLAPKHKYVHAAFLQYFDVATSRFKQRLCDTSTTLHTQ